MSGGLMQLVAVGTQDLALNQNPEITYFETSHKRHTNFAVESIEQQFTGAVGFGRSLTATLTRTGDLIHTAFLQVELPALDKTNFNLGSHPEVHKVAWTNSVGHALIDNIEIRIGGQKVDLQYGRWMQIWDELTGKAEKRAGMNEMIGRYENDLGLLGNADTAKTLYVPLTFWFCRNVGSALPLIALQFHEVTVKISLRPLNDLVVYLTSSGDRYRPSGGTELSVPADAADLTNLYLYCDYIYLDNDERKRFASDNHEYLIEQLQWNGHETGFDFGNSGTRNIRLSFNHPVKELVWTCQHEFNTRSGPSYNDWFNYSSNAPGSRNAKNSRDLLGSAQLSLNGHGRFTPARKAGYFRLVQPMNHHTRVPSKHIYCYSFALNPEEMQPSGTCNFSRIDNAQLQLTTVNPNDLPDCMNTLGVSSWGSVKGRFEVWAWSINQLRLGGGLGGLAYAN